MSTGYKAFDVPRAVCPFTGKPVEFRLLPMDGMVRCMIVADGWTSRIFESEEQAKIWFSFNHGLPPLYVGQHTMQVRRVDAPQEDPLASLRPDRAHVEGLTARIIQPR